MDKTLAKGLAVLEYLVESRQPRSVSDVALAFSLVPSNAHRTLKTLSTLGYVRQTVDSRYEPTLRLFEMGSQVVGALDIRHIAHQSMSALAADTLETIHLVVRDAHQIIYLDKVDSPQPVAAYSHIGGRAPAQCVASGKAALAWSMPGDPSKALAWLKETVPRLDPYTPHSHVDHQSLLEDLHQVRRQGYAVNRGEWREDVSGLGAPLLDAQNRVVGALGISLPTIRATPERLPELIEPLCKVAANTSALLGHHPGAHAPVPSIHSIAVSST